MELGQLNINGGYHRYNEISFMKGFSILTIVVMHLIHGYMAFLPQTIQQAAFLGGTGVHIFFFCSGFGLFMSHQNRQTKYSEFI